MSATPGTQRQWKARFSVHPDRVIVSGVLNLPDVTLVTESDGNNKSVISIEIVTPSLSLVDAIYHSQLVANRCADILSFLSGYGVFCSLGQINEIGEEDGTVKTGVITFSGAMSVVRAVEVDLTKPAFLGAIQGRDEKLARQLSHFNRGVSSSNPIEQIREFYLIIEDEYGENDPRIKKYKYVRDLVSHPELCRPKAKAAAIAMVGKSYFDPSEPNDLTALSTHLENIRIEARHIIKSKT